MAACYSFARAKIGAVDETVEGHPEGLAELARIVGARARAAAGLAGVVGTRRGVAAGLARLVDALPFAIARTARMGVRTVACAATSTGLGFGRRFDLIRRYPAPAGAAAGIAVLLLVFSSTMVSSSRERQDGEALVSAERARADGLGRKLLEAESLRAADMAAAERRLSGLRDELAEASRAVARLQGELSKANPTIAELREQLAKANLTIADLKQQQAKRRLSYEEKRSLIAALAPYRGQAISVAASYGDEDAKAYAEDLLQVLDAAGWNLGRAPKVSLERFARTPIGVEVTLNEADARAGRLSAATGALINAVRRLGLVDGNAIFMTTDVPSGGVQLRVGHRLRAETANAP
jgi:hypothetical protein